MSRTAHDQKSPPARDSPGPRRAPPPLLLVALSSASLGCNIVQGYQDAGDSLFPEQSTHLAAPGVRVASGNYRGLNVAAGAELFLLAREADDDTGKLFSMSYEEPRPCQLPGVVRLEVTRDPSRRAPLFSYFSEDARRSTLRFADARCNTFDLTFEDALLPVAETPHGVVVWAGSELWLASPETGERERLAEDVEQITRGVFGERFAVRAGGRLHLFGSDWKQQASFGDGVGPVLRGDSSLFYLDAAGAHRISASDAEPSGLQSTLLAAGACSLGSQDGTWITLRAACTEDGNGSGPVLAIHASSAETFTLPFDAEPTQLLLRPTQSSRGRDPLTEPFWFFYLRSGPDEASRDTLYVRTPAGEEHRLGAHATLRQLRLFEREEAGRDTSYGYALVDVEGEAGRYIWWDASGESVTLAERTLWRPDRLFTDSDGRIGNLAVASGQTLQVVAERVPWEAFEYPDRSKSWTVLFHDVQADGTGRLSVVPRTLDELEAAAPDQPLALPALAPVTDGVIVAGTAALDEVLSGVSYLRDYDLVRRTGTLAYRNLELRFTATVNTGVSDYLIASDELLYAVPYGKNAGIWLVAAK